MRANLYRGFALALSRNPRIKTSQLSTFTRPITEIPPRLAPLGGTVRYAATALVTLTCRILIEYETCLKTIENAGEVDLDKPVDAYNEMQDIGKIYDNNGEQNLLRLVSSSSLAPFLQKAIKSRKEKALECRAGEVWKNEDALLDFLQFMTISGHSDLFFPEEKRHTPPLVIGNTSIFTPFSRELRYPATALDTLADRILKEYNDHLGAIQDIADPDSEEYCDAIEENMDIYTAYCRGLNRPGGNLLAILSSFKCAPVFQSAIKLRKEKPLELRAGEVWKNEDALLDFLEFMTIRDRLPLFCPNGACCMRESGYCTTYNIDC